MKLKKFLLFLGVIFLILSISIHFLINNQKSEPKVELNLSQNFMSLLNQGECSKIKESLDSKAVQYSCPKFDEKFNLNGQIYTYNEKYDSFDFPILEFITHDWNYENKNFVKRDCLQICSDYKHIALIDGKVMEINTLEDLNKIALPLDSPKKALSYTLMTKDYMSSYEINSLLSEDYKPTFERNNNGFEVVVYNYEGGICCGTDYIYYQVFLEVSQTGEIKEISKKEIGRIKNRAIA